MSSPTSAPPAPYDLPNVQRLTVGVLGGSGDQGRRLAYRLARVGQRVILGSRNAERAAKAAAEIGYGTRGLDNAHCAVESDLAIVAVPWDGHAALLESLPFAANLIAINRRYNVHAGIRVTDVD